MNPRPGTSSHAAFTLLELFVVVLIIAVLAAMLLPARSGPGRARRPLCMSNQKQVVLGLIIFATDHQDAFPSMVSVTNGGALEAMAGGDVTTCYLALTSVIRNPAAFVCPTDKSRSPFRPGQPLARTNVSYFVSLDASPTNAPIYSVLTGDRHLESGGIPVAPGLFTMSPNQGVAWTAELHPAKGKPSGGAFGFADGHVEWVSGSNLSAVVARQSMTTNRLAVP